MADIVRAKRPRRVPTVLSRVEVERLLVHVDGMPGLVARLLYGSGLRIIEAVRLRVKDVDFARAEIAVRDGKGGKDRRMPLPNALQATLHVQVECALAVHGQASLARASASRPGPLPATPLLSSAGVRLRQFGATLSKAARTRCRCGLISLAARCAQNVQRA